jgi:hypothetical protein
MDMLMNSSETIVMDVAHVGNGSAWEIHALERWGFEELLPRALQPELLVYNQKGIFDDPADLRSVLESAVAGALTALRSKSLKPRDPAALQLIGISRRWKTTLVTATEPSVHQSRHPDRFNGGNLGFRRQTDPAGTAKTPRAVEKTMSQPIGSWEGGDRPAGQQIGPVIGRS